MAFFVLLKAVQYTIECIKKVRKMINKKVNVSLLYELENLHHVVVQASYVGQKNIYALQLLHKQTDIIVYRGQAEGKHVFYDEDAPVVYLSGKAGGHTQTWTYSGQDDYWYIGTKPKRHGHILWDTQIARLNLEQAPLQRDSNTQMPRLSYMNRAGATFGNGQVQYAGSLYQRMEIAVSPDYKKFMVATIDLNHVGHFALYDNGLINQKLADAAANNDNVSMKDLPCLAAFTIPHFNTDPLRSIQGYGLDQDNNIYVSSQLSPSTNLFGFAKESKPREIVKIPWGKANSADWQVANLDDERALNVMGYVSEFESVQVVNPDELYLTVAYHKRHGLTTLKNRVYRVTGFKN